MFLFWLKIRVLVQDGGNPRLSDVTTVVVYVNRNLFAPSFAPTQYSRTILDTEAVGVPLVKVTALDADTTVSYECKYTHSWEVKFKVFTWKELDAIKWIYTINGTFFSLLTMLWDTTWILMPTPAPTSWLILSLEMLCFVDQSITLHLELRIWTRSV